ncbi:MAG: ABC transporter permease [Chloroflexi bacterium]|nr:ABC transporter permease [Chloroflexota bacterium]
MRRYAIRRLLIAIPVLFLVTIVAASLVRLAPGDAVVQAAAESNAAVSEEQLDAIRKELGLDRPFLVQYGDWISGVFVGDFGHSLSQGGPPVSQTIKRAIPISLELAIMAMLISILIALPIGIWSAIRQDTPGDYIGRLFAIAGLSVPDFIIGTMVILFGAVWFSWTPPLTYVSFFDDPLTNLQMMITPALILGFRLSAITMRMLRSSMLEVLRQDYVRTAWAKGLRERTVIVRHALKNAFIPVITVIGTQIGFLVGGVAIIESICNLPGIGRTMITAIRQRDIPVIQTILFFFAGAIVFINLLVDLSYAWLDPRIRYE